MNFYITPDLKINEVLPLVKEGDTIYLKAGTYKEKVKIDIDNLTIIGDGIDKTIITNDDYYLKHMADHNECNTFRTFTLLVTGNNVTIKDLTIENSSVPSKKYGQAVSLMTYGDHFEAINLKIKGAQDTLFTGPLPYDLIERYKDFLPKGFLIKNQVKQRFYKCEISGDVDFIFGGAMALFEECQINAIGNHGFIAAPSQDESFKYGYLFLNCKINLETDDIFYLARPWRDYAKCVFINNKINGRLGNGRFIKWNDTDRHLHSTFMEYTLDEVKNVASFVKELSFKEADSYLLSYMKEFNKR